VITSLKTEILSIHTRATVPEVSQLNSREKKQRRSLGKRENWGVDEVPFPEGGERSVHSKPNPFEENHGEMSHGLAHARKGEEGWEGGIRSIKHFWRRVNEATRKTKKKGERSGRAKKRRFEGEGHTKGWKGGGKDENLNQEKEAQNLPKCCPTT